MFERFTERARRTVVLAQDEARQLGHGHIGSEHILLGMLSDGGGIAARALTSLGVTLEAVRQQVAAMAEPGPAPAGHIPFTTPAKRSLELALREALQLGYDYIGTEHILLGLIREDNGGGGAQVLAALGAEPIAVRRRVIELLPGRSAPSPRAPMRIPSGRPGWPADDAAAELDALARRLAAVEQLAGMTADLRTLDADIARVRSEKEAAIDAHNFQRAEELSERETGLLVDRDSLEREWRARPSLSVQLSTLRAELAGLRAEVTAVRSEVERVRAVLPGPAGEPAAEAAAQSADSETG